MHARQTAVERTACVHLTVVRGHDLALVRNIHLTDFERVHAEDVRQLVHRALHREQALRCAVATVRARRHVIGVHNVTRKAERLGLAVQRNRLMTGQTDRCRAVFAIRAGVGQRVQINAAHDAVLVCAQTDVHFHLMARRGCNLALHAAEDDLGRLFRHPGDKRRIHRADRGLLGAEAAADARFGDAHLAFRDMQCVRHDSAGVEHDLGRADDMQAAVGVDLAVGAEGFHHRLLACLRVVHAVDNDIAVREDRINITVAALVVRAQVAPVVRADRCKALPVVLRMHEHRIVLCGVEIEHRLEHLVLHLDQLHRLIHTFFVRTGENRHHIAYKAHMAVDDKAVIRAGLRISLAGLRVAAAVLVYVLPCEDGLHAGDFHRGGLVDRLDDGVRVRRAQQLDAQAVARRYIVHIHRLAGDELHRILFAERLIDYLHCASSSLCFFQSR